MRWVTCWLWSGAHLWVIQELLGHKNITGGERFALSRSGDRLAVLSADHSVKTCTIEDGIGLTTAVQAQPGENACLSGKEGHNQAESAEPAPFDRLRAGSERSRMGQAPPYEGDVDIVASNETLPLVIKFSIRGALRFLSHAETLRLFQRACVRAGINVRYSQGFNPRPKLSLPLPRPVGVESDDEVLCLSVGRGSPHHFADGGASSTLQEIEAGLSAQLPEGCELLGVSPGPPGRARIQPRTATYALTVRSEHLNDSLRATIDSLIASKNLFIQRPIDAGRRGMRDRNRTSGVKNIDVRPFLASIEMTGRCILIVCKISPAGSVRVEELLSLLQLDQNALAGPIRRTGVQWR